MSGYVYLLHAIGTNRYKIGRSINPKQRDHTINYQSPVPVTTLMSAHTPTPVEDEKALHHNLGFRRRHGEWFEFGSDQEAISLFKFHFLKRVISDTPTVALI